MSAVGQRLVPIRPSPVRGNSFQKVEGVSNYSNSGDSSATLTPPETSLKRKYEDDDDFDEYDAERCKRKINFAAGYVVSPQPVSISRRNARERNRVKQVNNGFAALRQHIPGAAKAKKISKVDTLKQAVEYIQNLQQLLEENDQALRKEQEEYMIFQRPPNSSSSTSSSQENYSHNLHSPNIFNLPPYFFNENVSPQSSAHSSPTNLSLPSVNVTQSTSLSDSNPISYISSPSSIPSTPPALIRSPPSLVSPTSPPDCSPMQSSMPLQSSSHFYDSSERSHYSRLDNPPPVGTQILQHPRTVVTSSYNNEYQTQLVTISPHRTPPPPLVAQKIDNASSSSINPDLVQPADIASTLTPLIESKLPTESAQTKIYENVVYDVRPTEYTQVQDSQNMKVKVETKPMHLPDTCVGSSDLRTYANLPEECASTNIANIDSALTSNLMSSFTNLVDVYNAMDPTTSLVDGADNLLDAIDLWEKC